MLIGAVLLGSVGVVVAASADVRNGLMDLFKAKGVNLIPYTVRKQKLVITVTERGNLESAQNTDVTNEVEGQVTILSILPEGSKVEKGDLVVELDAAALKDNRTNQEISTERSRADLENAKKTREVAEIAVREYQEGTFPQEIQNIEGESTLAQSELERAKDRLRWSEQMLANNYVSEGQVISDRLAQLKAEISMAQAERKMRVLREFTYPKQLTELKAAVEKARSDELAKEQTYQLEDSKLKKLIKQIDKTKLYAPASGLIVYSNETNQFRGNNQPLIEEGAVVRERQKIFSLPDIEHMQVNAKVHESMVDRVSRDQKAKIRVDAFPNANLHGTVKSIAPLPDPSSFFSSDIKVYTTIIAIDENFSSLRPGMTAEVTILIDTIDDALVIPVTAVLPLGGKDYVYKINGDGPPIRTEIKLGKTNDVVIQILEGLKEGDQVAMNPQSLLSEKEKREAFSATSQADAKAKDFGDVKSPSPGTLPGDAKGGDGKAKAKRKGGGNPAALFQKMGTLPEEDRTKLRDPSLGEEERKALLKKAGLSDDEIAQLQQMMQQMQSGGGGFGGGGPGGGGPGGGGSQ